MKKIFFKLKNIRYTDEKYRFLLFAFALFLMLFLASYLLRVAFARYEVRARLNSELDKALYILGEETLSFNLEPEGIVPRNAPYVYRFSISNFTETKQSDVDMEYSVKVRTTTNLPIGIRMYRNEVYNATGATNIFSGATIEEDEDGAYYYLYESSSNYNFLYVNRTTDVFYLVIDYPTTYANQPIYANYIEGLEVIIESKQIV